MIGHNYWISQQIQACINVDDCSQIWRALSSHDKWYFRINTLQGYHYDTRNGLHMTWLYLWTKSHYCDVIMGTMASLIISLMSVYSTAHSGADPRKHQSSASLAFVRGIHRRSVNSPHKWPVTRKMFPFDDVSMMSSYQIKHLPYTLHCYRNSWPYRELACITSHTVKMRSNLERS